MTSSHQGRMARAMEQARNSLPLPTAARLFIGVQPMGLVYADRTRIVNHDYVRLAFLPFGTLEPEWQPDCPSDLRAEIEADIVTVQARRGLEFQTDACGHTVLLGG